MTRYCCNCNKIVSDIFYVLWKTKIPKNWHIWTTTKLCSVHLSCDFCTLYSNAGEVDYYFFPHVTVYQARSIGKMLLFLKKVVFPSRYGPQVGSLLTGGTERVGKFQGYGEGWVGKVTPALEGSRGSCTGIFAGGVEGVSTGVDCVDAGAAGAS